MIWFQAIADDDIKKGQLLTITVDSDGVILVKLASQDDSVVLGRDNQPL